MVAACPDSHKCIGQVRYFSDIRSCIKIIVRIIKTS